MPRLPTWIRPFVKQPTPLPRPHWLEMGYRPVARTVPVMVSEGSGKERLIGQVDTHRIKAMAKKLPVGEGPGALRSLIMNDPDVVPVARLADYWQVALYATTSLPSG